MGKEKLYKYLSKYQDEVEDAIKKGSTSFTFFYNGGFETIKINEFKKYLKKK